jgi:hypothetical protein
VHTGTRAPGSESGERGRRSLHASLGARSPSGSCGSRECADYQFGPTGPFDDDQAPFCQPEPCHLQPSVLGPCQETASSTAQEQEPFHGPLKQRCAKSDLQKRSRVLDRRHVTDQCQSRIHCQRVNLTCISRLGALVLPWYH